MDTGHFESRVNVTELQGRQYIFLYADSRVSKHTSTWAAPNLAAETNDYCEVSDSCSNINRTHVYLHSIFSYLQIFPLAIILAQPWNRCQGLLDQQRDFGYAPLCPTRSGVLNFSR